MTIRFVDTTTFVESCNLQAFLGEELPTKLRIVNQNVLKDTISPLRWRFNCFAERKSQIPAAYWEHGIRRAHLELIRLPNGVFSPHSHAVFSESGEIYAESLDSTGSASARLASLATFDPTFSDQDNVRDLSALTVFPKTAVPICGPGFPNFGHFLYDGLPVALLLLQQDHKNIVLIGGALSAWQKNILQRLNLLEYYIELSHSTKFRSVIGHTMLHGHLPFPTRFLRLVFDHLSSSVVDDDKKRSDKVFLTRGNSNKRQLLNRPALGAALLENGFDILDPAVCGFDEVVRAMRAARLVVGEGGAAMANIGFCESGASVFEIQPRFFIDGYTRATCGVFGLDWNVYVACGSAKSEVQDSYSVDIRHLTAAIKRVLTWQERPRRFRKHPKNSG